MKDKRSYTIEYEAHSLLFEFTPAKGTKGDLAATAGEETVIGKLDLNKPSQRTTFIKECYQLYPDAFTLTELDFRRALNDLATHVDEEFKIRTAKAEEEDDLHVHEEDDEIEVDDEKVEALIQEPGVLDRYVEAMAEIFDVYEDRAQMKVVALGALSAQLEPLAGGTTPVGTNVMLIGEAGRGKNYVSDAVAAGMPKAFVYEFESASAKSFFYAADAEPDRFRYTWVYPNEAEATDMLVETLRPLLSKAKAVHNTVDTNADGANAFKELTIKGPLTVTIPTVRNKLDNQLQSRMLVIELEEFEDRIPKHSEKVSESLVLERALEDHAGEIALWKAALKKLTAIRRVGVAAHHEKFRLETNKISHGARLWRNFLSLMLTHAWLEQRNRKTVELENGETGILVTSEDYRAAYEVFSKACQRSVVELSETHRKILDAVYELEKGEKRAAVRDAGFSYRKIGEEAGCSYETVRKQKAFLVQSVGLLREIEQGGLRLVKDADPSWWAAREVLEGFPTPDQVKSWWEGENRVDTVDSTEKEAEKAIDKPNSVSTASSDKGSDMSTPTFPGEGEVDMSTPTSKGDVDTENAIGKPNSNGKSPVSTVSTLFEGLGEKVDTSIQKTNNVVKRAVQMVENSGVVALDLETTGLDPRESEIRLAQISDGEKIFVIDLFHREARALFEALAREDLIVLAHGGDFEWRFIYHHYGIALENIVDTLLMARLAFRGDTTLRAGLGDLAESELEIVLDKEMQTADWTLDPLPRRQLDYAAMDVKVLPPLYEKLSDVIRATGQARVAEIENQALPAFALMKYVGMPIDKGAWDENADEVELELRELERRMLDAPWMIERDPVEQTWSLQGTDCRQMLRAAGLDVEGTTAKDLAPYLENELVSALLAYRKAKGDERERLKARVLELAPEKPPAPAPPWNFGSPQQVNEIAWEILGFDLSDTAEPTLLRYKDRHPFFAHMLKHRKLRKLVSTYGKAWFQKAYNEETGRVHPAWWPIGTSTGRVASGSKGEAPNAQNLPESHRKFFAAPEGRMFVGADYSQIEVRVLAQMLNEESLLKIYGRPEDDVPSGDVYRATAAHMLNVDPDEVTKEQRNLAKAIVLGMNYGLNAKGLPYYAFTKLGIEDMSKDEAEEYVEAFYNLYPKIEAYHDDVLTKLDEVGSVDRRTMTGRLRAEITNRNEAINAPIQGTAADILKRAMTLLYRGLKLTLTAYIVASIHDELLVECDQADAEYVADVLEGTMLEAANEILNAEEPKVKIEVDTVISKVWAKG